jgi:hypothetical protein
MKEQIIKKPTINDYPSTDERTFVELDGKVNWEKYAKALDEFIQILAECKCDHSEDKLDKIDKRGGWICPRCGKVHSWLSMECDCPPKIITYTTDDIDLAYCAGIWNTGGIDVLSKELERLKHIGRKPHQIFQRYKPIKTE